MLYREPKLLKVIEETREAQDKYVSVLYREPKLLKAAPPSLRSHLSAGVSVLYREPKLLKAVTPATVPTDTAPFQCSTVSRNC